MNLIIAGGRDFTNHYLLNGVLDKITQNWLPTVHKRLISGCAKGADSLGIEWGEKHGYEICLYPANWEQYGKAAGYIRNEQMAKVGSMLVAFWDGKSKGTKHMIDLAYKYQLGIHIVGYYSYEGYCTARAWKGE